MEKKHFLLDSLSYTKKKHKEKLDINYHEDIVVNNEKESNHYNPKSSVPPSENFREAMNELRHRYVEIMFPKTMQEQMYHKVHVTGFKIKGDDLRLVKLDGTIECMGGKINKLSTHWIVLDEEQLYGNEDKLKENIQTLIDRVYGYLFEGEKDQYTLFEEQPKKSDEDGDGEPDE